MGLSHAAAAGILFTAAMMTGFQVSDDVYSQQDDLVEAWQEFYDIQIARASTSFEITDLKANGPQSRLFMTNTGSAPIDPDQLSVVYDGTAVQIASWQMVPGSLPRYWGPGQDVIVWVSASKPAHAIVVEEFGNKEVWP